MANQVLVSSSTGVMDPLIAKLNLLLIEHAARLKANEQEEVKYLMRELDRMRTRLYGASMMEAPYAQLTEWMRQAREVTYDAEDRVDVFLQAGKGRKLARLPSIRAALGLQSTPPSSPKISLASSGSNRPAFADQMQQVRARVADAMERLDRYKIHLDDSGSSSEGLIDHGSISAVTIDPQLISMQYAAPVGIQGPMKKIHKALAGDEKLATVTSIVGPSGIGKTTLAMQVYRTTQVPFDCKVFTYVGRRPSVLRVLRHIISQVSRQHKEDDIKTEQEAMTKLRDLLDNKRYLVIIDDIWSIFAWNAITCALPQNDLGSRIIVTTRSLDVARSCSSNPTADLIHEMNTLNDSGSKILFDRRVFGSNNECPEECREVRDRILKICGGLPIAIIVVASLLARTAKLEEWENVLKSNLLESEQYPLFQGVENILHISYMNLPIPIKSCFLYLCIFPKNYVVRMDRLIWRWIAEGFIPGTVEEESKWETGRSYFNELINRSLVQPVFTDDEADPVGCTVHGAIHDFIVSLSSMENFVTLDEELESMPRGAIRRLSLNFTHHEDSDRRWAMEPGSIGLSRARSLTVLGSAERMPPLSEFLLLRVLDLGDAEGLENKCLTEIGKLFNLKYLGLGGDHVTELPESIGELQSLETLDMMRTKVQKMPQATPRLKKLVRILAKSLEDIPGGFEGLLHLKKVTMLSVNSHRSLDLINELAQHGKLRSLGVKWCIRDDAESNDLESLREGFVSSLNKASKSNITSLTIHSDEACSLGFLATSCVPPHLVQKLVMKPSSSSNCLPKIPAKIASCEGLSYLEITASLNADADLLMIARLPKLTILKLSVRGKATVIEEGFGCLEVFAFQRQDDGLGLVVREGAMPKLRKLCVHFKPISHEPQQDPFCFGLPHLQSLQQVVATIDCIGTKLADVVSVEDAIKEGLGHINCFLYLTRENEEEMVGDGVQGRNH